jgi:hypothetical protein
MADTTSGIDTCPYFMVVETTDQYNDQATPANYAQGRKQLA